MLADGSLATALEYGNASSITNDIVVTETETNYDADGNAAATATADRLSSAGDDVTGALIGGFDSNDTPIGGLGNDVARATAELMTYDAAGRETGQIQYGTDGAALYSSFGYDAAGNQSTVTDPRDIESKTFFDMLGEQTKTVADYTDGTPTNDSNQTTEFSYDGDGHVVTMTAVMPEGTNSQTTAYVYGVGSSGNLYSNDLLA